jgi:plasmid stabilization system protein ParE
MKVAYAPRAVADLSEIGVQSRRTFGSAVAAALETYIRATVARIAVMPESGQRLPERPAVRVVPLVRYPFKIFCFIAQSSG